MGKSRLEQCQSTKELKYETTLRPLCGNLFEFTGFLGHVLMQSHAVVDLVSYRSARGFLDFFQFPRASVEHCKAQLSIFAQVDAVGNAWVAVYTKSSLDGHTNAGRTDVFLMKFDAQGVHQWTRQRGGKGTEYAYALQAVRRGATSFSNLFHGGKALDSLARSMFRIRWNGITVCGSMLIFVP